MWTLTIKTSLPNLCYSKNDLKVTRENFNDFSEAVLKTRDLIKQLAFSSNTMFDNNGYIVEMDEYIAFREENDEDNKSKKGLPNWWMSSTLLKELRKDLHSLFEGKNVQLSISNGNYNDGFVSLQINDNAICMESYGDGRINGIIPCIKTNMFDMTLENDYYLYVDDLFGGMWGQECSSELYVDLVNISNNSK